MIRLLAAVWLTAAITINSGGSSLSEGSELNSFLFFDPEVCLGLFIQFLCWKAAGHDDKELVTRRRNAMYSQKLTFGSFTGAEELSPNPVSLPREKRCELVDDLNDMRFIPGVRKSGSPYAFITADLVVKMLRSSERPETIYWLLRFFLESNAQNPVLTTDRGKTIYVEFNRAEVRISLYVGCSDSVFCVGRQGGRQIFAMEVQERYDFIWYSALGVALKRQLSAQSIQEQAAREDDTAQVSCPTLFYTTGGESVCVLRTDWYQITTTGAMLESSRQTCCQKAVASSKDISHTGRLPGS